MSFDFDKSGILALQYHVYKWHVLGSACCHNCRVDWLMGPCRGIARTDHRQKTEMLGLLRPSVHFSDCCRIAKASDSVCVALTITSISFISFIKISFNNTRKTKRQRLLYL